MINILWACAFIFIGAFGYAVYGAARECWSIWNSPVERALRGRDPMQQPFGDWPHQRGLR